jgi:hypothetical protein
VTLEERLWEIFRREGPPETEPYQESLLETLEVMAAEPGSVRPPDSNGIPGGLVMLARDLPTIIVPDLHARMDFFLSVMGYEAEPGRKALELMDAGLLQIVCLGDGVHAEGRAARRWKAALQEFQDGFERHQRMDEEMRESLGVMGMVMEVKRACPTRFHFLKGNHENISNEMGGGNFPFRKFALEGLMVLTYMRQFYGDELLGAYSRFEKDLPLLASGRGFLISHAEPATFFARSQLIDYRSYPDVVSGLTWTDNDEADEGSVQQMLDHYLGPQEGERGFYFAGHRPAAGGYRLRADGRFVQIHDPDRFVIAHLPASGDIDLGRDIREIDDTSVMAEEYG